MGLLELKLKIQIQLDNADEQLLTIVSSVFDNYLNQIVGYTIDGRPLNINDYNNEIEKGLDDIKNNRIISHQDLLIEMKSWKNE